MRGFVVVKALRRELGQAQRNAPQHVERVLREDSRTVARTRPVSTSLFT